MDAVVHNLTVADGGLHVFRPRIPWLWSPIGMAPP
jgi:hypothetical protein